MVLWGSMAFLVLMLLTVRGCLGWIVIPALMVGLYQLATKAPPEMSALGAYVWTWTVILLLATGAALVGGGSMLLRMPG
jgi:hypothetical protein